MTPTLSQPHIPKATDVRWRQWLREPGVLGGAAILAGLLGGALAIKVGIVLPLAFLIAVIGGIAILLDARIGLYAAVAVIALLPYATLPVKVGLTFTLLEAAILLTIAVWALRLGFDRSELIVTTPVFLPLGFFITATFVAFLLGAGRNTTTQTAHDYLKLLLGVSMIVLVVNLLRERRDVARFTMAIVAGGAIAGALAIILQRLPVALTTRLLTRLSVVGYPTSRVVRYLEDNPALAQRATGTGVDPNAFAGFLMLVLVLAVGQAVAARPLVARNLCIATVPIVGLALLLTQSRAAWLGAAVGVVMLALLRYRRLIVPLVVLGVAAAAFGVGAGYLSRLVGGLRGQDAATQLRFREYANALQLIRDYPVFGVGFGDAPRIDLQTGVSSVYLTVAERAGLIGLVFFLVVLVSLVARLIRGALRAPADEPYGELALAIAAALVAACVAATLDHYFFNLGFPHMAALFWAFAGLGEVALRLTTLPCPAAVDSARDARSVARYSHRP